MGSESQLSQGVDFDHPWKVSLVAGVVLYFGFWGLGQTIPGLEIAYIPSFSNSTPGELYFWLGHCLFLFPAGALIGFGASKFLSAPFSRLGRLLNDLDQKQLLMLLGGVCAFSLLWNAIGHHLIMMGYPFTDDEWATRFGGQALAMGDAKVPGRGLFAAMPNLFLREAGGNVFSFDWLGALLPWAIGEFTGTGAFVFAIFAMLPVPAIAIALGRILGRRWAVVGCLIFIFSPMAFALSVTSHTHVVSRGLLALGLCGYVFAQRDGSFKQWLLVGTALGFGAIVRPPEVVLLSAPLYIDMFIRLLRGEEGAAKALAGMLLGLVLPLVLLMAHNSAVTGNPLVPGRAGQITSHLSKKMEAGRLWYRFGNNISYNLLMLFIWFLGPLGLILVSLGALRNRLCIVLASGVLLTLAMGLLHQNFGIHPVGPIHYSECAVPLTIIAVFGAQRVYSWLKTFKLSVAPAAGCFLGAVLIGLMTFNVWNSMALRSQGKIHDTIYGEIESAKLSNAVVLAPQYARVWFNNPEFASVRSWAFEWRRPKPDFSDEVLILHDRKMPINKIRKEFPDREFYRLVLIRTEPFFRLQKI